jgi:hypothetical protein
MIKIFRTINDCIDYVLKNNLVAIDIQRMEEKLMDKKTYKSKTYGLIFIIDEAGILGND